MARRARSLIGVPAKAAPRGSLRRVVAATVAVAVVGAALAVGLSVGLARPTSHRGATSLSLSVAVDGSGSTCSRRAPCQLATALSLAGSSGVHVAIDLGPGRYDATGGFSLTVRNPSASIAIVGARTGSRLEAGHFGPVLSLAGTGSVELRSLTLAGGATPGDGGGVDDAAGPALAVYDSSFVGDAARDGGALYDASTAGLFVVGSTFAEDHATGTGGAIDAGGTPARIVGSTLVDDDAAVAGGVAGGPETVLEADVLARDHGGACAPDLVRARAVVADDTSCPRGPGTSVVSDAALFPRGRPMLADNGGPGSTVELAVKNDPAFDAVPASLRLPSSPVRYCSSADERGVERLEPSDARACSPGALQYSPPVLDRVSPPSGTPGSVVRLSGDGLALAADVTINDRRAPFTVVGPDALEVTIPQRAAIGAGSVAVRDPDSALVGAVATASITVKPPLAITTTSLNPTETGATYYDTIQATGGAGGDTWTTSSSMPVGLHLSSNGLLAGYPSTPGSFPIAVTVTDKEGDTASASFTLVIGTGPVIDTTSLGAGRVGVSYGVRLSASGGTPPYRWTVQNASSPLPGGLLLSSTGTLTGIPGTAGTTSTTLKVTDALGGMATMPVTIQILPPIPPPQAYVVATATGHAYTFGTPALPERSGAVPGTVVAAAASPRGGGYWLLTSTGRVLHEGDAPLYGSVGAAHLEGTPVGIAALSNGKGYWVVTSTGEVYGFGQAKNLGRTKAKSAEVQAIGTVVGIAASPVGTGYWLLGSTGQVAAFGDAPNLGSVSASLRLHAVAMATTPDGKGYLITSQAGRVFTFGDATSLGISTKARAGTFVSIAAAPNGTGYWLLTSLGRVVPVGSAETLEVDTARAARSIAIASMP